VNSLIINFLHSHTTSFLFQIFSSLLCPQKSSFSSPKCRWSSLIFNKIIRDSETSIANIKTRLEPVESTPYHNNLFRLTCSLKSSPKTHLSRRKGDRRYSSYSFTASALDRGEWSALCPGRALPPRKEPRYPLYRRLGGTQSLSGHRG
jgi:hypothetical protein